MYTEIIFFSERCLLHCCNQPTNQPSN